MPDAADNSCMHEVRNLEHDDVRKQVDWVCMDCGRVAAWIADEKAIDVNCFRVWAYKAGVPDHKVEIYLRTVTA